VRVLHSLLSRLHYDMHFSKHTALMAKMIEENCIAQYFVAFCTVDMNRMAINLEMDIGRLEKSVASLILKEKIDARIDSQTKIMYRHSRSEETSTTDKVLQLAKLHCNELKRDVLRLSLLQHGFMVDAKDATSQGGVRGKRGKKGTFNMIGSSSTREDKEDTAYEGAYFVDYYRGEDDDDVEEGMLEDDDSQEYMHHKQEDAMQGQSIQIDQSRGGFEGMGDDDVDLMLDNEADDMKNAMNS
jgi:hypothetical protein